MKMRPPPQFSLSEYWQGIAAALDDRLKASKRHLKHPVTGHSAEEYYRDLLRSYVPSRYAVDTGFVVDASGQQSDHIDIIIADTFHIPPLCSEPNYTVFAAESVCAVMEVTTSPKGNVGGIPKLESDVDKLARVRLLADKRDYMDIQLVQSSGRLELLPVNFQITLSPRAFLITSGDEWRRKATYRTNLISAVERSKKKGNSASWVNAAFSMTHGLLRFTPFKLHETEWIHLDPLLTFLLLVNDAIASYPTFKIPIRRYANKLPKI